MSVYNWLVISIHALRGEGDSFASARSTPLTNFNPRPPWGGRHLLLSHRYRVISFQSTPSVGRATVAVNQLLIPNSHFNPRPPWGGRRLLSSTILQYRLFQSTPSVGRATLTSLQKFSENWIFQSTPSVGRATAIFGLYAVSLRHFNPRPPWGGRR